VVGKRLNQAQQVWQYYVKSRKAEDYRQMMINSLYHPPKITVDPAKGLHGQLYLVHSFEGKQLVHEYIANTLMGIEQLWGCPVCLETSDAQIKKGSTGPRQERSEPGEISWQRVVYRMQDKILSKMNL